MTTTDPSTQVAPEVAVEEEDDIDKFLKVYRNRPFSIGALLEIIRTEAGLDEEDMEGIPLFDRFDAGNGVRWNVLDSPPGGMLDNFVIVAIFKGSQVDKIDDHTPGEARIYVAPRHPATKVEGEEGVWYKSRTFMRYKVSSVPGSPVTRELMHARQFIDEASSELNEMAVIFDVLEEDDEPEEKDKGAPDDNTGN